MECQAPAAQLSLTAFYSIDIVADGGGVHSNSSIARDHYQPLQIGASRFDTLSSDGQGTATIQK